MACVYIFNNKEEKDNLNLPPISSPKGRKPMSLGEAVGAWCGISAAACASSHSPVGRGAHSQQDTSTC